MVGLPADRDDQTRCRLAPLGRLPIHVTRNRPGLVAKNDVDFVDAVRKEFEELPAAGAVGSRIKDFDLGRPGGNLDEGEPAVEVALPDADRTAIDVQSEPSPSDDRYTIDFVDRTPNFAGGLVRSAQNDQILLDDRAGAGNVDRRLGEIAVDVAHQ